MTDKLEEIAKQADIVCPRHPKYQALRWPETGCIECYRKYLGATIRRACWVVEKRERRQR